MWPVGCGDLLLSNRQKFLQFSERFQFSFYEWLVNLETSGTLTFFSAEEAGPIPESAEIVAEEVVEKEPEGFVETEKKQDEFEQKFEGLLQTADSGNKLPKRR